MGSKRMNLFTLRLCLFVHSVSGSSATIFYDSIDETFAGRWIVPREQEGLWRSNHDYNLLGGEKTRKYAIVKELNKPVIIQNGTLVLQFETLLQHGPQSECGAVYLKYLPPQDSGWKPEDFNTQSPYSIMFGADICGPINKVHFIITQNNPLTEEYVQHHLKLPPSVLSDKRTQVFTAILKPGDGLRILVNGKEKRKASLLSAEDFEPPLVPAKAFRYQAQELDEEEENPKFESVVAIGIEMWTMRYGILVDNILIASDEKVAESYWEAPWRVEAERERHKKIVFDFLYKVADIPCLSKYKHQILDHIEKAKNQPEPRNSDYIAAVIFIALFITILFSWKSFQSTFGHLHLVPCSGGVIIETVVTKRAEEVDAWIRNIRSRHKAKPIVVGLDCEWNPNTVKFEAQKKAATLQLCVDTKCLIIQLFYIDVVPQSVHRFLSDPNFIFVGVEVARDITKLSDEYGLHCTRFNDLRDLALTSGVYKFCSTYGLRNLAKYVVVLEIPKPKETSWSNWEARDLDEEQIQYASIDAYASYKIGHKLINQMQD